MEASPSAASSKHSIPQLAAEARRAWATLKKMNGGKAWIRHARRHGLAHELADSGKHGARVYAEDVN